MDHFSYILLLTETAFSGTLIKIEPFDLFNENTNLTKILCCKADLNLPNNEVIKQGFQ